MATKLNLGNYERSQEFVIGFVVLYENGTSDNDELQWDTNFDPLDNDYIEVVSGFWDFEKSLGKGESPLYMHDGPELEKCSRERMT